MPLVLPGAPMDNSPMGDVRPPDCPTEALRHRHTTADPAPRRRHRWQSLVSADDIRSAGRLCGTVSPEQRSGDPPSQRRHRSQPPRATSAPRTAPWNRCAIGLGMPETLLLICAEAVRSVCPGPRTSWCSAWRFPKSPRPHHSASGDAGGTSELVEGWPRLAGVCVTLSNMGGAGEDDDLNWLPAAGARLTRQELTVVLRALRDLVRYTEDDPVSLLRLRVEEIGHAVSRAVDREPEE